MELIYGSNAITGPRNYCLAINDYISAFVSVDKSESPTLTIGYHPFRFGQGLENSTVNGIVWETDLTEFFTVGQPGGALQVLAEDALNNRRSSPLTDIGEN